MSIVFFRDLDRGMTEHGLDDMHLRTVLRESDSIVTTKILDEDPIQTSFLTPLVENFANVVPAGLALWVPEHIRAAGQRWQVVNPLQSLICERYESGLSRLGVSTEHNRSTLLVRL